MILYLVAQASEGNQLIAKNIATGENRNNIALLRVGEVSKSFGGLRALNRVSFDAWNGRITSIIGPNGAGKTTLFDIISGYIRPDQGTVYVDELLLIGTPPYKVARVGLYRTFQEVRLFNYLSVLDNVLLSNAPLYGEDPITALCRFTKKSSRWRQTVESCCKSLEIVGLQSKIHSEAVTLSYGQKKLLMLACGIQSKARLMLLDEPTSGVQQSTVMQIMKVLRLLVDDNSKTILLIEHDMQVVQEVSDWVVLLNAGEKVLEGVPKVVFGDPKSRSVFLE